MGTYQTAQRGLTDLKSAIHELLESAGEGGLTNAVIGRTLGIYVGHIGHEGHIPRTLLAIMESEGAVEQDPVSKRWHLRRHTAEEQTGGQA